MRRSSRAAVQDSSKATVSLRNQDLHMKAQPKQPRVPRVQKRDRLLDVPLTQEWLASSGQMTSCAKQPGSSGHEKPQPKVLFRDHELVWAKVRLPRGTVDTLARLTCQTAPPLPAGQGEPLVARRRLSRRQRPHPARAPVPRRLFWRGPNGGLLHARQHVQLRAQLGQLQRKHDSKGLSQAPGCNR